MSAHPRARHLHCDASQLYTQKKFCMIGALMVSDSAALTVVPLHHRAMSASLESHVDHPARVYFVGQQRSTWARRPRSDCSFCQSSAPAHAPQNGSSFLCASNFEWCVLNFEKLISISFSTTNPSAMMNSHSVDICNPVSSSSTR